MNSSLLDAWDERMQQEQEEAEYAEWAEMYQIETMNSLLRLIGAGQTDQFTGA